MKHILSISLASCLWILVSPAAHALVDTNNNGVSDLWEKHFNAGNLFTNLDPQADPDGDGWTNAQEAAAGTDPFDPRPPDGYLLPDFVHIPETWADSNGDGILEHTPEAITLTWVTIPGKQYTLQNLPDLTAGSWFSVGPSFIGNGGTVENGIPITESTGVRPDKNFWRVAIADTDTDGDNLTDAEEYQLGTNPNSLDSDQDGMSDAWELAHGLDPNDDGSSNPDNGANGDPDYDGFSNLAEYLAGTGPQNSDSYPLITPRLVGEQATITGTRYGFTGFQAPAKRYKIRVSHITSTDPDNDGDGGDRTDTDSYNDLQTGILTQTTTGNAGTAYGITWTVTGDTTRNRDGTDNDGSGETSTATETLAAEYTIPEFQANVESWIPAYHDQFTSYDTTASIALTPEATDPEPATEYSITKLKYKWQVNPAAGQVVSWLEVFTPADGSSPIAEAKSWTTGSTETESPVYEIDPTTRNGKKNGVYSLLPVDLDIIHPATGELADAKEDVDYGGYVSVQRLEDPADATSDVTPKTKVKIHAISGAQSTWKTRLKFNGADRYKIYRDEARTQEVVSEQTEFDATQDTTLFFHGLKKSTSRGGEIVTMQVKVNDPWVDGDSVKCTIVQSEFLIQVKGFIPYAWTEGEEEVPWLPNGTSPMVGKVAKGDLHTIPGGNLRPASPGFKNAYSTGATVGPILKRWNNASFRCCQTIVLTPYKELHSSYDLASLRREMTAPSSDHYVKATSVNAAEISLKKRLYGSGRWNEFNWEGAG